MFLTTLLVGATSVGLDVDDGAMRGNIALRVVDAGVDVCRDSAHVVRIRRIADGYRLSLEGERRIEATVLDVVQAVAELEIAQRITIWARTLPRRAGPACSMVRVQTEPNVPIASRALAVSRILERSGGLTAAVRRARGGRCLRVRAGRVQIKNGRATAPCASVPKTFTWAAVRNRTSNRASKAPTAPSNRSSSSSASTSTGRSSPPIARGPPRSTSSSLATTPTEAIDAAPKNVRSRRAVGPPWQIRGTVAGGLTVRSRGIDPTVDINAEAQRGRWGARAGALIMVANEADVRVRETILTAGPTVQFEFADDWSGHFALLAGVRWHQFRVEDDTGARWDLSGDAPFGVSWRGLRPVVIGFDVRAGIDSQSRRHVRGDAVLWERGAVRLTVGLSAGLALAP